MGSTGNNSSQQQDFYILLVFRFLFYLYFCYKILQLMFGSPIFNLKARIHRKIQFSYNELIAKQLSQDDLHGLQETIKNTLRNAQEPFNIISSKLNKQDKKQKIINKNSKFQGKSISTRKSVSFRQQDNEYFTRPILSQISSETLDSIQGSKQNLSHDQLEIKTKNQNEQEINQNNSNQNTETIIQNKQNQQQLKLKFESEKGLTHYPLLEQVSCEINEELKRKFQQQESIELNSRVSEKEVNKEKEDAKYEQEIFSDNEYLLDYMSQKCEQNLKQSNMTLKMQNNDCTIPSSFLDQKSIPTLI